MIVEVEAYLGATDKACHSYNNKRTKRTEAMFESGGISYVYLCYGMHYLFNVVVGEKNNPCAILIRAIEPIDGIKVMLKRRNFAKLKNNLTNGPGKLTQSLGITNRANQKSLIDTLVCYTFPILKNEKLKMNIFRILDIPSWLYTQFLTRNPNLQSTIANSFNQGRKHRKT